MLAKLPQPSPANCFHPEHTALLIRSYRHWTGLDLLPPASDVARALYEASFVVLSHDLSPNPLFTYANRTAQTLFEMSWEKMAGLPSRYSAEPLARAERERLLARVAAQGFINDYTGVRISASGKRFQVRNATVWNLIDEAGEVVGQAACFSQWSPCQP